MGKKDDDGSDAGPKLKKDNVGLFLTGIGRLEMRDCPMPNPPTRGEAILKMDYVGICGSDLSLVTRGELGAWKLEAGKPIILGHEPSATILQIGEGVTHIAVGDRVAVEHQMPDMACENCKTGRYNLCAAADSHTIGFPPTHGAIRRFMKHPAKWCYKVPANVPQDHAALVQPLAVALHACNRVNLRGGMSVLVTGTGPVGLLAIQAAKAFAASLVVATDIVDAKLAVAKEMGADVTVNVKDLPDGGLEAVRKAFGGGEGADVSIECSGAPPSIELAIRATRSGGKMAVCGIGKPRQEIPLTAATMREVDILGVCRFANCYPLALQLMAAGNFPNIGKMITHRYDIKEAPEAIKSLQEMKGPDGKVPIKVLIECNKQKDA